MITEKLARFVTENRVADIPQDVIAGARNAVIDTVGVALAGTLEPAGEIALRWVNELGAKPQANCWGQNAGSSPAEAAFANGICAHALDFDDSLPSLRGHPSATMVPAALAVAEASGSSGAEILPAYALGLEIAGKLGRGDGPSRRGCMRLHGTPFSSTAVRSPIFVGRRRPASENHGLAASRPGLCEFRHYDQTLHAVMPRARAWLVRMAREGSRPTLRYSKGRGFATYYRHGDGVPLAEFSGPRTTWEMARAGRVRERWPCCTASRPIAGC